MTHRPRSRRLSPVLCSIAIIAAVGCNTNEGPNGPEPSKLGAVVLSTPFDTAIVPAAFPLVATVLDTLGAALTGIPVQWSVSDTALGRIDPDGWLRLRRPGSLWVRASVDILSDSVHVEILPRVSLVTLTVPAVLLGPHDSVQLVARSYDSLGVELIGRRASWSTIEPAVATVDSMGLVRMYALDSTRVDVTIGGPGANVWLRSQAPFRWISVSGFSTCVGAPNGGMFCGGAYAAPTSGRSCELFSGNNTYSCPRLVAMPTSLDSVTVVSGHEDGLCGLRQGTVICWGSEYSGRLGTPTNGLVGPHPIEGPPPVQQLGLGAYHACARAGTALWCWGGVGGPQLGPGRCTTSCFPSPIRDLAITDLAVGRAHTCVVTTTAEVRCWGWQGGTGPRYDPDSTAIPMLVDSLPPVVALAAGDRSTCARTTVGAVWCWGMNYDGQLGDGTFTDREIPRQVTGLPAVSSLSAGSNDYCALDLTGALWCWGRAGYTTSGVTFMDTTPCGGGTELCRPAPTQLFGTRRFAALSLGTADACGIATDGVAYCWGWFRNLGGYGTPVPGATDGLRKGGGQP